MESAKVKSDDKNADSGKGGLYICPSARNIEFDLWESTYAGEQEEDMSRKFTYGANGWIITNYVRSPGSPGNASAPWNGANGEHLRTHGVTKLSVIRTPTETVYFMDHEFWGINPHHFDPFKSRKEIGGRGTATRWHDIKSGSDYGYGNIGWVDGHVSKEPRNFENFMTLSNGSDKPYWTYYFYDH